MSIMWSSVSLFSKNYYSCVLLKMKNVWEIKMYITFMQKIFVTITALPFNDNQSSLIFSSREINYVDNQTPPATISIIKLTRILFLPKNMSDIKFYKSITRMNHSFILSSIHNLSCSCHNPHHY